MQLFEAATLDRKSGEAEGSAVRHSGAPNLPFYNHFPFVILRACDFFAFAQKRLLSLERGLSMEKASSPPNNCPIPWQRSFPFQQPSPFCHPGAYPDFLLRSSHRCHLCGSPQREPHAVVRSRNPRQEIWGSRGICGAPFGCPKFTVLPLSLCHRSDTTLQLCLGCSLCRGPGQPFQTRRRSPDAPGGSFRHSHNLGGGRGGFRGTGQQSPPTHSSRDFCKSFWTPSRVAGGSPPTGN
jgi:hypothetical protein